MSRLPRYTRLARTGKLKSSGATKAKKVKRYAAYLKSAAWKRRRLACIEAAGRTCEFVFPGLLGARCTETDDLTAHHLTYARFGNELPEDLRCLCRRHHNALHGLEGKRLA